MPMTVVASNRRNVIHENGINREQTTPQREGSSSFPAIVFALMRRNAG